MTRDIDASRVTFVLQLALVCGVVVDVVVVVVRLSSRRGSLTHSLRVNNYLVAKKKKVKKDIPRVHHLSTNCHPSSLVLVVVDVVLLGEKKKKNLPVAQETSSTSLGLFFVFLGVPLLL